MNHKLSLLIALLLGLLVIASCKPVGKGVVGALDRDLAGYPYNVAFPEMTGWPDPIPVNILTSTTYQTEAQNLVAEIETEICQAQQNPESCGMHFAPNFISQPTTKYIALGTCDDQYIQNILPACSVLAEKKALLQYIGDKQLVIAGKTRSDAVAAMDILMSHKQWLLSGEYSDIIISDNIVAASYLNKQTNSVEYTERFTFLQGLNTIKNTLQLPTAPVDKALITNFFTPLLLSKINKIYHYKPNQDEYAIYNPDSNVPSDLIHFGVVGETYIIDAKEPIVVTIQKATGSPSATVLRASSILDRTASSATISAGTVVNSFITGSAVLPITGAAVGAITTEYCTPEGHFPGTCVDGVLLAKPLFDCYRQYHSVRDDVVAAGQCPEGYNTVRMLGIIWLTDSSPTREMLYSCYRAHRSARCTGNERTYHDHFVSTDPNCEGSANTVEGPLGFVETQPVDDPKIIAFQRCWYNDNIDQCIYNHMATTPTSYGGGGCPSNSQPEGTWYIQNPCIDTDMANDVHTKGTLTALDVHGELQVQEDTCRGEGAVKEFSCDIMSATGYKEIEKECPRNERCSDGACVPAQARKGEPCTTQGGCASPYECIEGICTKKIALYQCQDTWITTSPTCTNPVTTNTQGPAKKVGYALDSSVNNVPNTKLSYTCWDSMTDAYEGVATTCESGTYPAETLGYLFKNHQPTGTVRFPFPLLFAHEFYFYPESYCGDGILNEDAGEECEINKPNPTQDCTPNEFDNYYGTCTDASCTACECKGTLNCNKCTQGGIDYCTYCPHCGDNSINCGETCEPPYTSTCNANCQTISLPGIPPLAPPPIPPPGLPPLPHQFYGLVHNSAPGRTITATMSGNTFATIVDTNNQYGYSPLFLVTGPTSGATISFFVNSVFDQTHPFQQGSLTRLDLTEKTAGTIPAHCSSGQLDGDEGCVDGGGSCPAKCQTGQTCNTNTDCASNICYNGICDTLANICSNNILDPAYETDVDCGGQCTANCANGLACTANRDCASGYCKNGVCSKKPAATGGGGGGGGGGGSAADWYARQQQEQEEIIGRGAECFDDWLCDEWNPCIDGVQTRECFLNDYPECTLVLEKPETEQACEMPPGEITEESCFDGIQNQDETFTDCGGICKQCDPGLPCVYDADCVTNYCDTITYLCDYPMPVVEEIPQARSMLWIWVVLGLAVIGGGIGAAVYFTLPKHPAHLKELNEYVQKYRKRGVSKERIQKRLEGHGWKKEDIEKVLK